MENEREEMIEIQKHTSFLVEQFEYELQQAAHELLEAEDMEPEDLDNPGELNTDNPTDGDILVWDQITSDWKFNTRQLLAKTATLVTDALDLNSD